LILNIRVDHKTANISTMERSARKLDDIFEEIMEKHSVREHIQIKTCNRTEFYFVLDDELDVTTADCTDFTVETDDDALKHLLRLASGLESMIIGEDQILGQIGMAQKKGIKEGSCGKILKTVFTKAVHVGRVVRQKTMINEGSISIGSAAVELAETVYGDLNFKKVLVIGAGKMGTLVAKALVEKNLEAIVVANRTHDRAVELARELGGSAIRFDQLDEALQDADVVISATGAPHPILSFEKVKNAVPPENLKRMVMVDIANPRDIDPKVADLSVKLFNIDDLREIASKSRTMRRAAACDAEKIVNSEFELLKRSLKDLEIEPLISNIMADAENIRVKDTQKAFRILENAENNEKVVNDLTKVLVEHIFYDVIKNLKDAAEKNEKEVIKAAETIFSHE
jgi:glutamyl-tRNA reductase